MKNLEELKNNEKIQEILDQKVIKSQRQPKNVKRLLACSTFGKKTQHKESLNARKKM